MKQANHNENLTALWDPMIGNFIRLSARCDSKDYDSFMWIASDRPLNASVAHLTHEDVFFVVDVFIWFNKMSPSENDVFLNVLDSNGQYRYVRPKNFEMVK